MSQTEREELDLDADVPSDDYVDKRPVRPKRITVHNAILNAPMRTVPGVKKNYPVLFWISFCMQLLILVLLIGVLFLATRFSDQMKCLQIRGFNSTECD